MLPADEASPVPSGEKEGIQQPSWWADHGRRAADATLLLAAGTIGLAIFSLIQISDFRDQERRQLRPYVYAIPQVEGFAVGEKPRPQIQLKNGGQTAAFNPNGVLKMQIRPFPQAEAMSTIGAELQPKIPIATPDGIGAFIYRDHETVLSLPKESTIIVSPDDYAAVKDGTKKRLYVWGRVLYLDTFGRTHHLNFCFTFDGEALASNNYHYCVDYNDTDMD